MGIWAGQGAHRSGVGPGADGRSQYHGVKEITFHTKDGLSLPFRP